MEKIAFALILLTMSCSSAPQKTEKVTTQNSNTPAQPESNYVTDLRITNNQGIKTGDVIQLAFITTKASFPDSIKLAMDGIPQLTLKPTQNTFDWETKKVNPGLHNILATFYWEYPVQESKSLQVVLNSDIIPEKYTYKVIKSWTHNSKAYTQGLEFSNGFLYEGTGQYGESMLYKIDVTTNEIVQSLNLPGDVFGEGISIFNDKIYQLTWRSNVGYVYDKDDFKKLFEFNYPTEGWGLTNNGKELIMSDGSENIYFLDPEFFQETRRIQVYDSNGPQKSLNELEWIGNEIFANVYGSDRMIAFDPKTGKITKDIDLSGLLNPKDCKGPIDVLNGIAYNAPAQQLVVTGKWWPKFFQIALIKR
ncbi:MAG TPA: glutamine cyclotransferase [Marinilabiliales bacterium]|nr:MAG: hypothetical protein A2W84_07555 [Bacteroidetes bacterium GWC2_40_13]OFX71800.1 MAG: hypothetical protein A2W96_06100 [Bacteroidetes bacterium GWD2_40_43]OFX94597.1 MAG: hypothetical protein A2W97_17905 [Bacteroidetes bacterium GWE2_40_63]OFY22439.1 MAG: hypothetical protein A2W88_07835 [Bacteroidetes bacterium GWF2_40_13]OFZ24364.1 MAG: hypothetical protein A2437_18035 [Bacteroidetes bacterium RIFOXYC2_FULL_40_12]HAM98361.1 glutamine cyclotransferase [Marinilabiliales bacterium]